MEPKLITGGLVTDDRGTVRFVNDFVFAKVVRFYQVENHRSGFIRAWHGHKHEEKYVYVPRGTALIGAVNLDNLEDIYKTILSADKPAIYYIPNNYANGFKTLQENTIVQFFSTSTIDQAIKDDIRFPYDTIDIWGEDPR